MTSVKFAISDLDTAWGCALDVEFWFELLQGLHGDTEKIKGAPGKAGVVYKLRGPLNDPGNIVDGVESLIITKISEEKRFIQAKLEGYYEYPNGKKDHFSDKLTISFEPEPNSVSHIVQFNRDGITFRHLPTDGELFKQAFPMCCFIGSKKKSLVSRRDFRWRVSRDNLRGHFIKYKARNLDENVKDYLTGQEGADLYPELISKPANVASGSFYSPTEFSEVRSDEYPGGGRGTMVEVQSVSPLESWG